MNYKKLFFAFLIMLISANLSFANSAAINSASASPLSITPDNNGIDDTITVRTELFIYIDSLDGGNGNGPKKISAELSVEINDSTGVKVWSGGWRKEYTQTGQYTENIETIWNGKDEQGNSLPAGLYKVYVKAHIKDIRAEMDIPDTITLYYPGAGMEQGGTISPETGGTLTIENGATLTIPPGALSEPVTIIIRTPMDNHGMERAVELLPTGLTFLQNVTLTLPYLDPDDIPQGHSEEEMTLLIYDENLNKWVKSGFATQVDLGANTITSAISHFTAYSPGVDVTPPDTPSEFFGEDGDSLNYLIWKQAPDTDTAGYFIYRGGERVSFEGPISGIPIIQRNKTYLTYQDRDISNQTIPTGAYSYYITAVDTSGNESLPTQTISLYPRQSYIASESYFTIGTRVSDKKGIGDINGDGLLDLISWAHDDSNIIININSGSLSMDEPAYVFSAGLCGGTTPPTYQIVLRDFNGDGYLDALFSTQEGDGTTCNPVVKILKGNNTPPYFDSAPFTIINSAAQILDSADINNDGKLDIVYAEIMSNGFYRLAYLPNNGNFTFLAPVEITRFNSIHEVITSLAVGDLNQDSYPDIVMGRADAEFTPQQEIAMSPAKNMIFINQKNGTFIERSENWQSYITLDLQIADIDQDGLPDIIEGSQDGPLTIYHNKGYGDFDTGSAISPVNAESITTGDIDNDGDTDIIIGTKLYRLVPCPCRTPPCPVCFQREVYAVNQVIRNANGVLLDGNEIVRSENADTDPAGALLDGDNDNDMDLLVFHLLQTSGTGEFYKNLDTPELGIPSNDTPQAPANLASKISPAKYLLSWSAPADLTEPAGLTYNVRAGSSPGASDLYEAEIGPNNTSLRTGSLAGTKFIEIPRNWQPPFYWSVQAVDTSFARSNWASEAIATIGNLTPPTISNASFSSGTIILTLSSLGTGANKFNLYYGYFSGNYVYTKTGITPALSITLPFFGLTSAQTVYIVLTSVDLSHNESIYSNAIYVTVSPANPNQVTTPPSSISTSTTWSSDKIYKIIGDVTINYNGTLTIEPGTIIKFGKTSNNLITNLKIYGNLNAIGDPNRPIIFTSINDDLAGGHTSGSNSTPSRGDWGGIILVPNGITNVQNISNSIVRYGGSGNENAELYCNRTDGTVYLSNVAILESSANGIKLTGMEDRLYIGDMTIDGVDQNGIFLYSNSFPNSLNGTISNITIRNTAGKAVYSNKGSYFSANTNISAENCGINGVYYAIGSGSGTTEFHNIGIPYVWDNGTISVTSSQHTYIDQGVIIKLVQGGQVQLNNTYNVFAEGTPESPIIFTSIKDDTVGGDTNNDGPSTGSAGDWDYFHLNLNVESNLIFKNIYFKYGGGVNPSAFWLEGNGLLKGEISNLSFYNIANNFPAMYTARIYPLFIPFCKFVDVANLEKVQTYNSPLFIPLSYWGSLDPTDANVSGPVFYNPWLTSPPTLNMPFSTSIEITNTMFNQNPSYTDYDFANSSHLKIPSENPLSYNITITDSSGASVYNSEGTGNDITLDWDGKRPEGVPLPDGTYNFYITDTSGSNLFPGIKGQYLLDSNLYLAVSNLDDGLWTNLRDESTEPIIKGFLYNSTDNLYTNLYHLEADGSISKRDTYFITSSILNAKGQPGNPSIPEDLWALPSPYTFYFNGPHKFDIITRKNDNNKFFWRKEVPYTLANIYVRLCSSSTGPKCYTTFNNQMDFRTNPNLYIYTFAPNVPFDFDFTESISVVKRGYYETYTPDGGHQCLNHDYYTSTTNSSIFYDETAISTILQPILRNSANYYIDTWNGMLNGSYINDGIYGIKPSFSFTYNNQIYTLDYPEIESYQSGLDCCADSLIESNNNDQFDYFNNEFYRMLVPSGTKPLLVSFDAGIYTYAISPYHECDATLWKFKPIKSGEARYIYWDGVLKNHSLYPFIRPDITIIPYGFTYNALDPNDGRLCQDIPKITDLGILVVGDSHQNLDPSSLFICSKWGFDNDKIQASFNISKTGNITIELYKLQEACSSPNPPVAAFNLAGTAGLNTWTWDGSINGTKVPAGKYELIVKADDGQYEQQTASQTLRIDW